jgi:hypothetical protein
MTGRRTPAWRLLFLLLTAFAMIALLLAAACGGDDDDDDSGDDNGPTATDQAGDDDDDGGGDEPTETDQGDGGDDDDGGDDGDDPLADLEELTGEYESVDGTISYAVTTDGEESTWVIYQEGDNSRIDFGEGEDAFISITTPEASYTCFGTGDGASCIEGEGGVGTNPFAGLFTSFASAEAIEAYAALFADIDVETSNEEIAGVDGSCFSASGDFEGDAGTVKWCFSDDGVLLLALYDFESGSTEMRVTDYSGDVADGVFEPPYEVTDFGQ